jgi:hypothetical protein
MPGKNANRQKAQRLYPEIGRCERCLTAPACDRHHIDENTENNHRVNLEFLCRRCHVHAHGLKSQIGFTHAPKPRTPCRNCGRKIKPLRNGRCHTCDRYLTVRGVERPYKVDGRREKVVSASCSRCGKAAWVKGLCRSCYRVAQRCRQFGKEIRPFSGKRNYDKTHHRETRCDRKDAHRPLIAEVA